MPQEGRTALELALENGQEEAAAVLRAHGAQVSLFFAAEKGMQLQYKLQQIVAHNT